MSAPIRVRGFVIPAGELIWRFSRSSGPGGQSVNTTDSRVELGFDLAGTPSLPTHLRDRAVARLRHRLADGVLTIAASEYRSQHRNREAARARLVDVLSEALKPPPPRRRATKPSRAARERRLNDKARRAKTKAMRRRPVD